MQDWNKKKKKQQIIDTKHKNPFSYMNIGRALDLSRERKTVLGKLGKGDVVFGSYAFNKQVPYGFWKKLPLTDIDIKSKTPKKTALAIEKGLDTNVGFNNYFIDILEHPDGKTYRIKSRARGQEVVADIGKASHKIPTKNINYVNYETLSHRKKEVKKMLKSKEAEYRREKDQRMLGYINRFEQSQPYFNLDKDSDGDGIPDISDCAPLDKTRQGLLHRMFGDKTKVKVNEEEQQVQPVYVMAKVDGKWNYYGAYSRDHINVILKELKTHPDVEDFRITEDPKEYDRLTRKQMTAGIVEGAGRIRDAFLIQEGKLRQSAEKVNSIATPRTPYSRVSRRVEKPTRALSPYQKPKQVNRFGQEAVNIGRKDIPNSTYQAGINDNVYYNTPSNVADLPDKESQKIFVTNAEYRELQRKGYTKEDLLQMNIHRKFGYSHRSRFYKEKSPFYNYNEDYETCVSYRPIGYYQCFLSHDPATPPNKFGIPKAMDTLERVPPFKPVFITPFFVGRKRRNNENYD